jgi:nitrous oxide reductase accessory protein NosL
MTEEKQEALDLGEFAQTIAAIDRVETDPERHLSIQIDAGVRDAVNAAKASGKKAKFTIEVIVEPHAGSRIQLQVTVKSTLPKPPTSAVVLYTDDMGRLHNADPAQLKLPHTSQLPAVPTLVKKEN